MHHMIDSELLAVVLKLVGGGESKRVRQRLDLVHDVDRVGGQYE